MQIPPRTIEDPNTQLNLDFEVCFRPPGNRGSKIVNLGCCLLKQGAAVYPSVTNICHLSVKVRYSFCVWEVSAGSKGKHVFVID